nr:transmembrane protein LIL4 [Polypedilum vanderplanki]
MEFKNIFKGKKFLWFFDLDTGAVIIGALGLLFAEFQLVLEVILLLYFTFGSNFCLWQHFSNTYLHHDIFSTKTQNDFEIVADMMPKNLNDVTINDISCTLVYKYPLILILITAIFFNIISMIAHYKIVKAVEERNSAKFSLPLSLYKFFIGIKTIFLTIWTFFSFKIIYVGFSIFILISIFIDVYIYSIIDRLRVKYLNQPSISFIIASQINEEIENKVDIEDEKTGFLLHF